MRKIPGTGEKIIQQVKKTKSGIKQLFVPGMFFEDMGITYLGPVDGHDIRKLYRTFCEAKRVDHAVLVHVLTKKGKGYTPAEEDPARFHGTGPFEIETGKAKEDKGKDTYTEVFSKVFLDIARHNEKVVGITAAMADGTGLVRFAKKYPQRYFDVGIAEGHAVTFAAGLAAGGMKPVFAVYSSFLQRGYDQLIHDACLQNLPIVFAIDREMCIRDRLEGVVTVSLALNLKYNYSIMDVSGKVQEKVKNAVETMTGLEVADVNIKVAGVEMSSQE